MRRITPFVLIAVLALTTGSTATFGRATASGTIQGTVLTTGKPPSAAHELNVQTRKQVLFAAFPACLLAERNLLNRRVRTRTYGGAAGEKRATVAPMPIVLRFCTTASKISGYGRASFKPSRSKITKFSFE